MNTFNPVDTYKNEKRFSSESQLSLEDQRWIQENTPLLLDNEQKLREIKNKSDVSVNVYESVNGGCKYTVTDVLGWPKYELVFQLNGCNSKDSPKEIARLLKKIFEPWPSHEGHWLWIAQRYTARAINRQLSATIKEYLRGAIRKTPAIYFTFEIGFRKKRKLKHIKIREGNHNDI